MAAEHVPNKQQIHSPPKSRGQQPTFSQLSFANHGVYLLFLSESLLFKRDYGIHGTVIHLRRTGALLVGMPQLKFRCFLFGQSKIRNLRRESQNGASRRKALGHDGHGVLHQKEGVGFRSGRR